MSPAHTDPRRTFVEMVGRLSRKTQMHLDEQQRHVEINKIIVFSISVLLIVVAAFNMYFIKVLYQDLNGIVDNMDSMHTNMLEVSKAMNSITDNVESFEIHMRDMDQITRHTGSMAQMLPSISNNMSSMAGNMNTIDNNMGKMSRGMTVIDQRFGQMTGGVANMRHSVRQISRPMGVMNPFFP
ncbi:MAG: translation initiation factor 2 [gamma proteobacterium symbiont of Bathyaustriella thionipta]|nr:translation initiation factor 2 [gamma proteobacterium symbiont of Bathyaustriella thionipta]